MPLCAHPPLSLSASLPTPDLPIHQHSSISARVHCVSCKVSISEIKATANVTRVCRTFVIRGSTRGSVEMMSGSTIQQLHMHPPRQKSSNKKSSPRCSDWRHTFASEQKSVVFGLVIVLLQQFSESIIIRSVGRIKEASGLSVAHGP